ncbi:MAG: hypothetical protein NVS3B5_05370 [Sphingomicrobium sp.]
MKAFNLMVALALIGTLGSPAAAQMANSMGNSMGNMGTAPMPKGTMPDRSMGKMGSGTMDKGAMHKGMGSEHRMKSMHHKMSSKMAMCHGMSHHQMMHSRKCAMMMKHHHHGMMKHGM